MTVKLVVLYTQPDDVAGFDEGQATAGDYQQIAPPGSRMFAAAVDE